MNMAVTFDTNWTGGLIGGLFGAIGGAQRMSYINDMYENMWAAAVSKYKATEDAVNIMKGAAEAQLRDSIAELERVGASYQREVEESGKRGVSKMRASREGLTGGITQAKQEVAAQIQINKAAAQTQEKTQSMINQVVDQKDKLVNQYNMQLMSAYNEMQGALARQAPTESAAYRYGNIFSSMIKGFGQGWQLEGRIRDAMRPPVPEQSYALTSAYKTVKPEFAHLKPFQPATQFFIQ
jgi:hypothetical protein